MDKTALHRRFFADVIAASSGAAKKDPRIAEAFAEIPREKFLGPGPWKIFTRSGNVETPTNDPALLYQDFVVAISPERGINNGQPSLHALCFAALNIQPGETVLHIGAGWGYYTAILSRLVGNQGKVIAYEIERDLAESARANLAEFRNVVVEARSGTNGSLPEADGIYVNAGATSPPDIWLDALRIGGRLLFPLTPGETPKSPVGAGAMLLVTRKASDLFGAKFLSSAAFIPCAGARDEETAQKLAEAFYRGGVANVRSLRRSGPPDESCWVAGNGWWLSTREG